MAPPCNTTTVNVPVVAARQLVLVVKSIAVRLAETKRDSPHKTANDYRVYEVHTLLDGAS